MEPLFGLSRQRELRNIPADRMLEGVVPDLADSGGELSVVVEMLGQQAQVVTEFGPPIRAVAIDVG